MHCKLFAVIKTPCRTGLLKWVSLAQLRLHLWRYQCMNGDKQHCTHWLHIHQKRLAAFSKCMDGTGTASTCHDALLSPHMLAAQGYCVIDTDVAKVSENIFKCLSEVWLAPSFIGLSHSVQCNDSKYCHATRGGNVQEDLGIASFGLLSS